MIELKGLCAGYGGEDIVRNADITFPDGMISVIIGPNGSGKSTLLQTAVGLLPSTGGKILIDGLPAEQLSGRTRAQHVAYLAQTAAAPNITARRLVLHGRFPYLSYPRHYSRSDLQAAEQALIEAGAADLGDRSMQELSGGERQRVRFAMLLAQDTQNVLLDEPTNFLDINRQLELAGLAKKMASRGKAVVMVLHDIRMALQLADRIAVLKDGAVGEPGPPEEVFSSGAIDRAFGVTVRRYLTEDGPQYYFL